LSSSTWTASTGRSLGAPHSQIDGYAQYHRQGWDNIVASGGRADHVADGVHIEAGVGPGDGNLLGAVGAHPGFTD
jgi:hypothetical protein